MAKKAKTNSSSNVVKWSKRSRGWLNELVDSSNTARDNSYKFIALIMLDKFGSLQPSQHDVTVDTKAVGWFGKFPNTASEVTKQNVHDFLASKKFSTFERSYYGKIWSDVTRKAANVNLAGKENSNKHFTYKVEEIIEEISAGRMKISIAVAAGSANPTVVQGNGKNGTSKSNWYKQKPNGSYVGGDSPTEFPRPFPISPAACKVAQDVIQCREYWKDEAKKAQDNLDALKPMLKKSNGRNKFTAYVAEARVQ